MIRKLLVFLTALALGLLMTANPAHAAPHDYAAGADRAVPLSYQGMQALAYSQSPCGTVDDTGYHRPVPTDHVVEAVRWDNRPDYGYVRRDPGTTQLLNGHLPVVVWIESNVRPGVYPKHIYDVWAPKASDCSVWVKYRVHS